MDAAVVASEMTGNRPEHPGEGDEVAPFGGRDLEPLLLLAVSLAGATLAWGSGAGRGAWTATTTLAVLAGSAWLARRRDRRPPAFALRASRAGLALGAAAVAVGVGHGTSAVLLAWFPAVCAAYTLVFAAGAATAFTTAALGVLAVLAAAPPSGGPSETAFAACAVAVLAVSLAGRTLRAVLGALRGARRGTTAVSVVAAPETVVATEPLTSTVSIPPPASLPDRDQLLQALAAAQSPPRLAPGRAPAAAGRPRRAAPRRRRRRCGRPPRPPPPRSESAARAARSPPSQRGARAPPPARSGRAPRR